MLIALFCVMLISFSSCNRSYRVSSVEGSVVKMDSTWNDTTAYGVSHLIGLYKQEMEAKMNVVVGKSDVTMTAERPEGLLSNVIVDALCRYAETELGIPVDMALLTMGGIRASLYEGDITIGDVYEALPFDNTVCVLGVKGTVLRQIMNEVALTGGEALSNVRLTIASDKKVRNVLVGGKPIDDNRLYTVATINYLATGNDGMASLAQCEVKGYIPGVSIRDVFLDYIERCADEGLAITSRIEGRVVIDK
jgi:5''-nucleotidase/2'',3''-cyclic phosphodiesterase and related esterases